uniref:histidine kinase n=1 Tax=Chromera velia CCMP2878 TaxID=1169474 RepID=A0A0G4I6Y7_9ALVE|eukprot:Cvel_11458.t1-p1 / transcript=Cvel_11458.t1 / gene=Cvel_11458 / organism=Chromera_velia_CCMP2878 / gene_product=Atrial natriuretic peptide receptor 2, putative / transcript_product=Atrial natriuretic peptide receptor 2, putative / location=Cvel_scaffold721:13160-23398(+) / protein_length=1256 / sequence_SO=supercontig / SO=protein_coding / is_pseudo=false
MSSPRKHESGTTPPVLEPKSSLVSRTEPFFVPGLLALNLLLMCTAQACDLPKFTRDEVPELWLHQLEYAFPAIGCMILTNVVLIFVFSMKSQWNNLRVAPISIFILVWLLMSYGFMRAGAPIVVDVVNGRPFMSHRTADWSTHVPLLMYQLGSGLFCVPYEEVLPPVLLEVVYTQIALWAHMTSNPFLRFGCLAFCWIGFMYSSYWMALFPSRKGLQSDAHYPAELRKPFHVLKAGLVWFLILMNFSYGINYTLSFFDITSVNFEMAFWCVGDVCSKGVLTSFFLAVELFETFISAVSQAMEAKEQVHALQTEMNAIKKIEDGKNKFLRFIFHEVRVPLHAMMASLEMLADDMPDNRYVHNIQWSAEVMKEVLNDVLTLQQMKQKTGIPVMRRPFSVHKIVQQTYSRFLPLCARKTINFRIVGLNKLDEEIKHVGDSGKILQMFSNGISNAVKYTPKGGSITLKVKLTPCDAPKDSSADAAAKQVELTAAAEGQASGSVLTKEILAKKQREEEEANAQYHQLTYEVTDSGVGLSPANLKRLMEFQPFTQIDADATVTEDSSGLGLGIVREIAQAHGGEFEMASEGQGKGTSFIIKLPLRVTTDEGVDTEAMSDASRHVGDTPLPAKNKRGTPKELTKVSMLGESPRPGQKKAATRKEEPVNQEEEKEEEEEEDIQVESPPSSVGEDQEEEEEEEAEEEKEEEAGEEDHEYAPLRLLVVDDDEDCREATCMMLERLGAVLQTACDGIDAVERVEASQRYDLIVMDNLMPRMNGVTATAKIRALGYNKPILALTANVLKEDQDKFREAGVSEILNKGALTMRFLKEKMLLHVPRFRKLQENPQAAQAAREAANKPKAKPTPAPKAKKEAKKPDSPPQKPKSPKKNQMPANSAPAASSNQQAQVRIDEAAENEKPPTQADVQRSPKRAGTSAVAAELLRRVDAEQGDISLTDATAKLRGAKNSDSGEVRESTTAQSFAEAYARYVKQEFFGASRAYDLAPEILAKLKEASNGVTSRRGSTTIGEKTGISVMVAKPLRPSQNAPVDTASFPNCPRLTDALCSKWEETATKSAEAFRDMGHTVIESTGSKDTIAALHRMPRFPACIYIPMNLGDAGATQFLTELELQARFAVTNRMRDAAVHLLHENEKSHKLLSKIMPEEVSDRLKNGETMVHDQHDAVTIFFSDIVGFTKMTSEVPTSALVLFLNKLFSTMDLLTEEYEVYKVETIGDAYMCASGHDGAVNHVVRMLSFAQAVHRAVQE